MIARHPWLVQAMPALGPRRVATVELGLTALRGTPLPVELRVAVIGALSLHVLSEGRVIVEATQLGRLTDPGAHPAITAALAVGAFGSPAGGPADVPEDEYDVGFGLTLMLDGIQALIDRVSADATSVRETPGGPSGAAGRKAQTEATEDL